MNIRLIIISFVVLLIIVSGEYIAYLSFYGAEIIKSKNLGVVTMTLGLIIPIIFIVTIINSYKHYSYINSILNSISSMWLALVLYLFIVSFVIYLLLLVKNYLNINIPIDIVLYILASLSVIVTAYGVWNSYNPIIKYYDIDSSVLSKDWEGKNIVIVSDIHIGNTRRDRSLNKIISMINKENPDIVFVVGDLIEGTSFPYREWLASFDNLKSKLGNYYVEGNHEQYSQEYDIFRSNFPKNLTDITNKKVTMNGINIIGLGYNRDYKNSDVLNELNKLSYDKNQKNIVLMHDPKNIDALIESNASLVISGHTHAGQLFPFNLIVNLIYKKYAYGLNETNTTTSITSSGAGASMIPARIGTTPEIVVLRIK